MSSLSVLPTNVVFLGRPVPEALLVRRNHHDCLLVPSQMHSTIPIRKNNAQAVSG